MDDGMAVDGENIQRVVATMFASAEAITRAGTVVGGCGCGPDDLGRDYRGAGAAFVDGHARMARVVALWTAAAESLATDIRRSVAGYVAADGDTADSLGEAVR